MTTVQPIATELAASTTVALDVRWSCSITRWTDPFGLLGDTKRSHASVHLVISLDVNPDNSAAISARVEQPAGSRTLLTASNARCETRLDGSYLHLDAQHNGRRLLSLSLDQHDRLVYARTELLADAGFAPGTFDPPTVARRSANSAMAFAAENANDAE